MDKLLSGAVDHEGIKASANYLGTLVQQELDAGISNVVVGGFSQVRAEGASFWGGRHAYG